MTYYLNGKQVTSTNKPQENNSEDKCVNDINANDTNNTKMNNTLEFKQD